MSTLLQTYEPHVYAPGTWPTVMLSAPWRFTFAPNRASGQQVEEFNILWWFQFGTTELALSLYRDGVVWIFQRAGAFVPLASDPTFTFSAGQVMELVVDLAGGELTLSGATTGNGTRTFTPITGFSGESSLAVGRLFSTGRVYRFDGYISDFVTHPDEPAPSAKIADTGSVPRAGAFAGISNFRGVAGGF